MAQGSMDSDRLSSAGISTHSSGTAGTMGGSVVGVRVGENNKKEDEEDYNLGPLPLNWEKAFTPNGEVYFIDHNMGTSHWLDPRLARVRKHSLGECGEDELPYGWERVTDKTYGSYYVDHINRKTQYENPVLQARRLRAEKSSENGDGDQQNGSAAGELRGTRFTVTLVKGTLGLGFTMVAAEGIPEIEGYLQIRNIVPHSPAWNNGSLRAGDVVVGIGSVGVRGLAHHQVVQLFQTIAPGDDVTLHLVRGYPPSFDSEDPNTRVLRTLAVDAKPEPPGDSAMHQLTRALRTRFNLESPSGPADEADGPGPQRRLLSRSFDLDAAERPEPDHRCPSADHLLTLATEHSSRSDMMGEPGRELVVMLQRGNAGFGFTIADSVHGQKVKKVLDVGRCAGLREGDVVVQVGATRVRGASHARVVAALQACPPHEPTAIRVWRRAPPRARSASRVHNASPNNNLMGSRSKTPTADQLRNTSLHTQDSLRDRLNGIDNGISPVEATYAVPEPLSERRLLERRRSTPPAGAPGPGWQEPWIDMANVRDWENNQKWEDNRQKWDQKWDDNVRKWDGTNNGWEANGGSWNGNPPMPAGGAEWGEAGTPTVHVDMAYWRHRDHSIADSEDNGGFPEDGMLHSPTTAAISGLARQSPSASRHRGHSPTNSGRLRSHSPSTASATDRLLANSPSARLQSQSPSNNSSNGPLKGSPLRLRESSPPRHLHSPPRRSPPCYDAEPQQQGVYVATYPQVSAGGAGADPCADVLVRLARGGAGFGFRIVGGTEDGSRVAVGYVVPGGPADGLLRPGDLLTSVDGIPLAGATHARAVSYVCQAATRGHVTLGVRHNRADIQPLGLPQHPHSQQHLTSDQMAVSPASYNIVHPAPVYPPQAHLPMYGAQYGGAGWAPGPYDVTVSRGEGEGFGFVVISSTNKATSTIGQLIPNSPAARCGLLHVGDTIIAINHTPIRNLPHPEVVALIKHSGSAVTLTVASDGRVD